jgi:hypothetical protein
VLSDVAALHSRTGGYTCETSPKPGNLCLVIGDLIDEGKVVTAVRPRSLGAATLWQITPRCAAGSCRSAAARRL